MSVAFALGLAISFAGPALPLAVTLAAIACIAIAIAQLARHIPAAGGIVAYAAHGLGGSVGFGVGMCFLFVQGFFGAPTMALLRSVYTSSALGQYGIDIPWWVFVTVFTVLFLLVNLRSVTLSTTVAIILGTIELVAIAALAVWMIAAAGGSNTVRVFDPGQAFADGAGGLVGIFQAMALVLLAFSGFEGATPLGEEARNPRRSVPIATIGSAVLLSLFFLLASYGAIVGWGFGKLHTYPDADDPWQTLGKHFWVIGWLVIFFAIANSIIGGGNAAASYVSRILFSLGRAGVLPHALARTHPTHRTPQVALVASMLFLYAVIMALTIGYGSDTTLGIIGESTPFFVIVGYMSICIACPVYYLRDRRSEFRPLLHLLTPALGVAMLCLPLYYTYRSIPSYPTSIGFWANIGWLTYAFVTTLLVTARRPDAIRRAAVIFAE